MPSFDDQRAAQSTNIPRELLEQLPEHRGGLFGGGSVISQTDGVLLARVTELTAEIRALRQQLSPPSTVILTGAEVTAFLRSLQK